MWVFYLPVKHLAWATVRDRMPGWMDHLSALVHNSYATSVYRLDWLLENIYEIVEKGREMLFLIEELAITHHLLFVHKMIGFQSQD